MANATRGLRQMSAFRLALLRDWVVMVVVLSEVGVAEA
jgi:hypothetical protein